MASSGVPNQPPPVTARALTEWLQQTTSDLASRGWFVGRAEDVHCGQSGTRISNPALEHTDLAALAKALSATAVFVASTEASAADATAAEHGGRATSGQPRGELVVSADVAAAR